VLVVKWLPDAPAAGCQPPIKYITPTNFVLDVSYGQRRLLSWGCRVLAPPFQSLYEGSGNGLIRLFTQTNLVRFCIASCSCLLVLLLGHETICTLSSIDAWHCGQAAVEQKCQCCIFFCWQNVCLEILQPIDALPWMIPWKHIPMSPSQWLSRPHVKHSVWLNSTSWQSGHLHVPNCLVKVFDNLHGTGKTYPCSKW